MSTTGGRHCPRRPDLTPWACSPGPRPANLTSCSCWGPTRLSDCPDAQLAAQALEGAGFVVAIDAFLTPSAARADVVLPAAMYTERRGSFTNLEGRVTWLGQKVTAPGSARPDWIIAVQLASRLGSSLGAASLEDLWAEIRRCVAAAPGRPSGAPGFSPGRNGVGRPPRPRDPSPGLTDVPPPLDPMADPGIARPNCTLLLQCRCRSPAREGTGAGSSSRRWPWRPPSRLGLGRGPSVASPALLGPSPAPPSGRASATTAARTGGGCAWWRAARCGTEGARTALTLPGPPAPAARPPGQPGRPVPPGRRPCRRSQGEHDRVGVVVPALADAMSPPGRAVLPFNLPGGGAGSLIDASASLHQAYGPTGGARMIAAAAYTGDPSPRG